MSGSQWAVWNVGPAKVSSPGQSGMRGTLSRPTAEITASKCSAFPAAVRTSYRACSSSHCTEVTAVPSLRCGRNPNRSTTSRAY
jgi:hypothetical protein